jgi:glucose-6-phosphate 1-dehydrogenase
MKLSPTIIVIFGGAGDLTWRKLIPSLFDLQRDGRMPEQFATLLWDVMKSDPALFMRADQVEAAWEILMPILDAWAKNPAQNFPNYASGSWGPKAAMKFSGREEHKRKLIA